jgi:hypothetical protein
MTTCFGFGAIIAPLYLWPPSPQVLDVLAFRQSSAIRTHEDQRVWNKSDLTRLIKRELPGVDMRLLFMIQKGRIEALFGQNFRLLSTAHCPVKPTFDKLLQMFE